MAIGMYIAENLILEETTIKQKKTLFEQADKDGREKSLQLVLENQSKVSYQLILFPKISYHSIDFTFHCA